MSQLGQQLLAELSGAAESVGLPSEPCCSGLLTHLDPQLHVEGVGPIQLPLGAGQAEALRQACALAPLGRGTETIRDLELRRTWQLEPQKLTLRNPKWESEVIPAAIQRTKLALGIPGAAEVEAQLYRLLLYDQGSFFVKHRDSEKCPGMFGTLTVCLPSQHETASTRYTEESLQQRGVDALKGPDRAAAQLLRSACQRGADLDAQLAVVQCVAVNQIVIDDSFATTIYTEANWAEFYRGGYYHECEDDTMAADPKRLETARACKFIVLAGPQPAFASIAIDPKTELLFSPANWAAVQPDLVRTEYMGNEGDQEVRRD
ncbi:2og-fe oxygenase superfamily [Chlorella sorokiniana]|uniref:2og-fe oxygenase superfamily n=1 Tax=Chlorella sorokiniana TaxID=3076 RepID=A0A2P6TGQ6_CHLSO|nr:2og-fe oxygenase superfamily [Chlorella sorokiniana]|eukprot:PRW33301.1 2og-fe oxygenase superfamily [Chlorella sorokiniana]